MQIPRSAIEFMKARLPDLLAIYHFGSTSHKQAAHENEESDVDLAVLCSHPLPQEMRTSLSVDLATALGRDVDLLDLRGCDSVITAQVLEAGPPIFVSDAYEVGLFETTAMSKYCTLNEERRGILEDIQKRGRVHAR